ncbi:hypothetical protein EUGRSUZ_K03337 [Eucalyptus grandis]|uniref:Isopenicillin N synthase-like Fe(2+) 2OG dioxygenase domain-containing protein n=2 Tax=Eucalyptus grandis TaxID=71139 RepID=A0A059A804_EUCGR|nr:hypothetical protein EUGRSUZ_K03337 [Eucalyptus grandis]
MERAEAAPATVMQPYELSYSDLVLLSSPRRRPLPPSSSPEAELSRLDTIKGSVMEALGPGGPGLLCVRDVPEAPALRRELLPLARRLALLDPERRRRVLQVHQLGTDVPMKDPHRNVSSFAMQLRYAQGVELAQSEASSNINSLDSKMDNINMNVTMEFQDKEFDHLGFVFKKLGSLMMELGLGLARICDEAIGGHELEQSLVESCSAKGRLIHYHSRAENLVLEQDGRRFRSKRGIAKQKKVDEHAFCNGREPRLIPQKKTIGGEARSCGSNSTLWQQWHYDYGIFTVLTAPMFLSPARPPEPNSNLETSAAGVKESPCPDGLTYLQILNPIRNNVFMVKTSPESFIIQVGEAADVLSRGKLRSTLHCVCRPPKVDNVSRETFVVFLQPVWSKTFSLSDYPMDQLLSYPEVASTCLAEQNRMKLIDEIQKTVPPLFSRLKDGMTFAEFSRETTKQYYGGSGLQSNGLSDLG